MKAATLINRHTVMRLVHLAFVGHALAMNGNGSAFTNEAMITE